MAGGAVDGDGLVSDVAATDLALVPSRRLVEPAPEMRIALPPGDRALVAVGDAVSPGDPVIEHVADPRVAEVVTGPPADGSVLVSGGRWSAVAEEGRFGVGRRAAADGELLAPVPGSKDRWRIATGEHRDPIRSLVAGTVTSVRPGADLRIAVTGRSLPGVASAGTSSRGRLELATDPFGELRPGGIDVGRSGSILVVGARIDAEALTRARAMGVRGIVTASLAGKDLRDFLASERRQLASLHLSPPFGVLVIDGTVRRPLASPVLALLERLAGREVGLLVDPPALVFDAPDIEIPEIPEDWVRVRHGPGSGVEGRFVAAVGPRRFAAGVHLEAGRIRLDAGTELDVPISDLQRFTA
jgi:hypothetical protein